MVHEHPTSIAVVWPRSGGKHCRCDGVVIAPPSRAWQSSTAISPPTIVSVRRDGAKSSAGNRHRSGEVIHLAELSGARRHSRALRPHGVSP